MKTYFILCILIGLCFGLHAQNDLSVAVADKEMSQGLQTGFVVTIPEAGVEQVVKQWKLYVSSNPVLSVTTSGGSGNASETTDKTGVSNAFSGKDLREIRKSVQVEEQNNELVTRNVVLNAKQQLLDIYTLVEQPKEGEGIPVTAFFRFKDSVFIAEANVDEQTLHAIKDYMHGFAAAAYRDVVEDQIDNAERDLRRMKVVLSNLESVNRSLNKDIDNANSDIKKCRKDLDDSNKQMDETDEKTDEINKQMSQVHKKSLEYKSFKDMLKDQKKEKNKISAQIKRLKSKIDKDMERIKDTTAEIVNNGIEHQHQEQAITKQQQVLDGLKDKLSRIN